MSDETQDAATLHVAPGEFPDPLTKGPKESGYLTWLRNHSNYMATRGFLEDREWIGELITITESELPKPRPKKKRKKTPK